MRLAGILGPRGRGDAAGYGVVRRLAGDDVLDAGVDGIGTTTVAELLTL
jgi:hypothetical protein